LVSTATGLTGTGNDSANVFNDQGGANTSIGLGGDDTYYVNDPNDVVTETGGAVGGIDTAVASTSFSIATADVEILISTGTGTTATGNALNNSLFNFGGVNAFVEG
jgi:hypothetical protein